MVDDVEGQEVRDSAMATSLAAHSSIIAMHLTNPLSTVARWLAALGWKSRIVIVVAW
jgi:hypothetical protein